jgi:lysophospholipase L1-like esterase
MERIKELLKSDEPIKWVFAGDSITHGAFHTLGCRDYVQIFEERVRYEKWRIKDAVIRTAISGWITGILLENIDWNILQYDPDVVSIMIGMNDAAGVDEDDMKGRVASFYGNYNKILDTIAEKTHAEVILHTPNPVIPGLDPMREPNLPTLVEQIKQIGRERNIPVVDHWTEWNRAREENPIRTHSWMNDFIHPGAQGHRAFARLLLKELDLWDENTMCCGSVLV